MGSRAGKISPRAIAALKPGNMLWDTELPRFGARRRAAVITYVVKARIDGRQRWITLGRHGPLTPYEARARARKMLGQIDSGEDPTRERDGRRGIPIFSEFAERWLREHIELKRKPATAAEYRRIIHRTLNPALGKVRIDRIDRTDAIELHASMAGAPYVANRTLAILSSLLSHAERLGYRQPFSNAARGVERYREHRRKRPLSREELSQLWQHIAAIETTTDPYVVAALRLLLLTGMRRGEVLGLRWCEVDLAAGVIHLADSKTGPRDVYLPRQASALLEALPVMDGNPYIFLGRRPGQQLTNLTDAWHRIRRDLGFPDVRLHDLRHTVASLLARSAPMIVVRDALGHRELETTNGYSHAAADDVRNALEALAETVTGQS